MFQWIALAAAVVLIIAVAGAIVSSKPPIEPSQQQATAENQNKKNAAKGDKSLWDSWFPDSISVYTLFLVIFTAVLSFAGLVQLKSLERAENIAAKSADAATKAADAAKESVKIYRDTLVASQRAWLRVEVSPGPLRFAQQDNPTGAGAAFSVSFRIKNTSDTPAVNVSIHAKMAALTTGPFPLDDQRAFCEEAKKWPPRGVIDFTIFPGDTFPHNIGLGGYSHGLNISRDEIERAKAAPNPNSNALALFVYGCVDYAFPTDPEGHHQTRFFYRIERRDHRPLEAGAPAMPPEELVLSDGAIGGGRYAD